MILECGHIVWMPHKPADGPPFCMACALKDVPSETPARSAAESRGRFNNPQA